MRYQNENILVCWFILAFPCLDPLKGSIEECVGWAVHHVCSLYPPSVPESSAGRGINVVSAECLANDGTRREDKK